jgi:hypothetical protein
MSQTIRYVRCRVLPGIFDDEYYVMVAENAAYVDRHSVRVLGKSDQEGGEVEGEVLAYLIDEGDGREEALVELAGEPVVGGLRAWVPKTLFAGA